MKRLSLVFLLFAFPLWAQNTLEQHILKSKYAVDSIVAAQKAHYYKQLASVEDLLEQQKISKEEAKQMEEDFKARTKQRTRQLIYAQAQTLQSQLDKALKEASADSLLTSTDTLASVHTNQKTMAQVDSLARRQETNTYFRRYVGRTDHYSPYIALGVLNLSSAEQFGDKRLSPLGSKSFERGI